MTFDLISLGWGDDLAGAYAPLGHPCHRPGRVCAVETGVGAVLTASGLVRASFGGAVLAGAARDPRSMPCVGDWVVLLAWPDRCTTIEVVLPRRTCLLLSTQKVDPPADRPGRSATAPGARTSGRRARAGVRPAGASRATDLPGSGGRRPGLLVANVDSIAVAGPGPVLAGRDLPLHRTPGDPDGGGADMAMLRPLVAPGRTLAVVGAGAPGAALVRALVGAEVLGTTGPRLTPVPGGGAVLDVSGLWDVSGVPTITAAGGGCGVH